MNVKKIENYLEQYSTKELIDLLFELRDSATIAEDSLIRKIAKDLTGSSDFITFLALSIHIGCKISQRLIEERETSY